MTKQGIVTAQDISIGNGSTGIQTLASESVKVEKPLRAVQTRSVDGNTLQTLAELLSLIQEDCRRYSETLAVYLPSIQTAYLHFDLDGVIFIAAPPGHRLDTGNGHILLDGKPVTGWGELALADTDKALADTGAEA
jgi:hypothetical protein